MRCQEGKKAINRTMMNIKTEMKMKFKLDIFEYKKEKKEAIHNEWGTPNRKRVKWISDCLIQTKNFI